MKNIGVPVEETEEMRKAFILAAGLGTRLRPWTLEHPKALVPVGGRPMLSRVIGRLAESGFTDAVINVHHFGDQIVGYINENRVPLRISFSDETDALLDTGGGLLKAAPLLFRDGADSVLVHNVDILSNADLAGLMKTHEDEGNDITLLVSQRESSRCLYFSEDGRLEGWENLKTSERKPEGYVPSESSSRYAFSGIYVVGRRAIELMHGKGYSGAFPIMDFMLAELKNLKIRCAVAADLELIDIGKPETLAKADSIICQLDKANIRS